MSWMPRDTLLGELKLVETYFEYDGPRIFSCISLTDQLYLALWVNEGDTGDDWLYVPVSHARLNMIRSGGLSLRNAIQLAEGMAYSVFLPYDDGEIDTARPLAPSSIPEVWLPQPDASVEIPTHTLPLAEPQHVIEMKALQESRTRLRLRVKVPDSFRSEAPAGSIGKILVMTQSVYDNFGYSLQNDSPSPVGRIPADISSRTAVSVVGASAASFVLELASNELDDLFGESLFADVTRRLLELLDLNLEYAELANRLVEIKPRAAKSFRKLVEKFAETGGDVTVAAAGSSIAYSERYLPADRLQSYLASLSRLVPDEEVASIRGRMRLFKVDTERRTFGVRNELVDPPIDYEGAIDDLAWPQASHATVQENYDVLITGVTVLDEAVGEKKTTYRLVQISPTSGTVEF
jgi:hypothetical protein